MYKNILEKFNFKMDEIKLFDSFAGIGALHKANKKLGVPIKLVGSSEIDPFAIMSYAVIHDLDLNSVNLPSEQEMKTYLLERNIGWDFEKQKSSIKSWKGEKLKRLYQSCIAMKNYGDISIINYNDLPDFDLFNFSFCCQSVSNAGKQEGMTKDDGSITKSGLYIYGMKLIKAKMPKYIMIENVKGLIGKKFIGDFNNIINELESNGYNCYYLKKENGQPNCLNAKDYRIPQDRQRIYVICIRKDIDNGIFEFPKRFELDKSLYDVLLSDEQSSWLSDESYAKLLAHNKRHKEAGHGFKARIFTKDEARTAISPTVYTVAHRGDSTYITNNGKLRTLQAKEAWRLMGFDDEDIDKCSEIGISNSQLYRQAGNSIVVNVLYYIFKNLFKEYIVNN